MSKSIIGILFVGVLSAISGCASTPNKPAATASAAPASAPAAAPAPPVSTRQCEKNFTVSGNFLKGREFKSFVVVPNVSQSVALKKVATALIKKGNQVNVNESMGIITAGRRSASENTATVEPSGNGVKIDFVAAVAGGSATMISEASIKQIFCEILESAN